MPLAANSIKANIINSTSANISWITSYVSYTPELYTVHYFRDGENEEFISSYSIRTSEILEEFVFLTNTSYSILLDNLSPYTTYLYYVVSCNTQGNTSSSIHMFVTAEDGKHH